MAGAAAIVFMIAIISLVIFLYCNRKENKVAHGHARSAEFLVTNYGFEEPLSEIIPFLIYDVTIIGNY